MFPGVVVFTPSTFPALGPRRLTIFGCMFAVALFGVACGSSQAQKASQSSPPPAQTGTLSVSSNSLQFNTVVVGQNSTQSLQLSNQGAGAIQVTALSISNSQFSISGASVPFTVNPSSGVSLTVTFAPTSSGSASAMLSISSNASDPQVTVSLAGTGQSPTPAYTVQLTWDASTSQVVGYIVLRGETSGGPYTPLFATALNALSYTDATVASGATYYYVVTAIGETGIESGLSNQVTVVIP
jgi:hypothetical protein